MIHMYSLISTKNDYLGFIFTEFAICPPERLVR